MTTPIPQPPGVPLLGNIFDVDPGNTWVSLKKLADKYGEIFKIKALGHQIVFICSAALLEEICDEKRFRKCVTGPVVEIRYAVNDCLFTAYDHEEIWGIAHRIMAPLLTPAVVEKQYGSMQECASKLSAKWRSKSGKVDITDDLRRLNLVTATKCFFSQDSDALNGPESPMIAAMENATQEAVKRPTRPKILNTLIYGRQFTANTKTMRNFASEIVKTRESSQQDIDDDMLHALLHGKDPQSGKSLEHSQVIDEVVTLYIGAVTAPNFLAFLFYYLVSNPEEIVKAQREIDSVLSEGEQLTSTNMSKLTYCEAILREGFRLSAPAPGFNIEPIPEKTTGPVQLLGGKYEIPKDQIMISILAAVNRDPAVFDDPETFKPSRMLGEEWKKYPSSVQKGFGNGKRECIGKVYAWKWSFIALVSILRDFDLEKADDGYELKMDGAFSVKPVGFYVNVTPRQK